VHARQAKLHPHQHQRGLYRPGSHLALPNCSVMATPHDNPGPAEGGVGRLPTGHSSISSPFVASVADKVLEEVGNGQAYCGRHVPECLRSCRCYKVARSQHGGVAERQRGRYSRGEPTMVCTPTSGWARTLPRLVYIPTQARWQSLDVASIDALSLVVSWL